MSPPAWPLSGFGQIALFQFYAFFWDQKSRGVHLEPELGSLISLPTYLS
jgi:hypothetical protein